MLRLAKPLAPLVISLLALVPGPLHGLAGSQTKVASRPETPTLVQAPPVTRVPEIVEGAYLAKLKRFYDGIQAHNEAVWYQGVRDAQYAAYRNAVAAKERAAQAAEAARQRAALASQQVVLAPPIPQQAPAQSFGNLSSVVQCIKNHESGNYSESSHPGSGSGAYQFIPGTWQTWSARAGYGGYSLAYLAPPSVQDAVLMYTLTHGGAGNWSNQWGNDPCTAGL